MKAKKILSFLLALLLCAACVPLDAVFAVGESVFPTTVLTEFIDQSNIDWNQLLWQSPTQSDGHIFGSANQYCLFTFDNVNVISGAEITGKSAIGGILDNRGTKPMYQIGRDNGLINGNGVYTSYKRNELTTLIGDHLDGFFTGSIYGWIASKNRCNLSNASGQDSVVSFEGPEPGGDGYYVYGEYVTPENGKVSDLLDAFFTSAKSDLQNASTAYMNVKTGTKGIATLHSPDGYPNELLLKGTDANYNVFEVTTDQLESMSYLTIDVPDGAYTQINVAGSTSFKVKPTDCRKKVYDYPTSDFVSIVAMDSGYKGATGKDSVAECQRIFWNMPDATEIIIGAGAGFPGSILAPKAHLQLDGLNTNGTIIVDSATCNSDSGEFHYYPFDYSGMPVIDTGDTPIVSPVEKTSVTVSKTWVGTPGSKAVIHLIADGAEVGNIELNASNNWEHTFSDLLKKNADTGNDIVYTITEDQIDGYTSDVVKNSDGSFTVTNTKVPAPVEKTSVSVTKKWVGPVGSSVTVCLVKNGVETKKTLTLTEQGGWHGVFSNLPKKDGKGQDIAYTVKEKNVNSSKYTSEVTGNAADGFLITNTNIEKTNITVRKNWVGTSESELTVVLKNGSQEVDRYTMQAPYWGHVFRNLPKYDNNGLPIVYTVEEVGVDDTKYTQSMIKNAAGNSFVLTNTNKEVIQVPVKKTWKGGTPVPVTVKLFADGQDTGKFLILSDTTSWQGAFEDLPKYGSVLNRPINYRVKEDPVAGFDSVVIGKPSSGFEIINTPQASDKVTVGVTKRWLGMPADGTQVTITLYRQAGENGVKEKVTTKNITSADNWQLSFTELDKADSSGTPYNYSITEEKLEGYIANDVVEVSPNSFVVINRKCHDISVTKQWVGGAGASATIQLNAYVTGSNVPYNTVSKTLNTDTGWTYTFKGMPDYTRDGKELTYKVTEKYIPGYTSEITENSNDSFTVTNTKTTSIHVKKQWVGPARTSVTVALRKEGSNDILQQDILSASSNWECTFRDLPKYDDAGVEIQYALDELNVPGYKSEITKNSANEYVVTNTKICDISVTKKWVGQTGTSANVKLEGYVDGNSISASGFELNASNNWTHVFADMPEYTADGKQISYRVSETAIPGYAAKISGNQQTGFVVTNIESCNIKVSKKWIGAKGESITVKLMSDGMKIASATLNEANNWEFEFKNQSRFTDFGKAITYQIEEENLSGYQSTVSGDPDAGFIVTNVETRDIPVHKDWIGLDGEKVELELHADGELVKTAPMNGDGGWDHTFTDLPKYNPDGSLIDYTLTEKNNGTFTTAISGNADDGFKLLTIKRYIDVTKKWNGPEAEKITLELLANGTVISEKEITAADQWKYRFEYLEKYDSENQLIVYTVREKELPGYTAEVAGNADEGFVITNTHTSVPALELRSVTVKKTWVNEKGESAVIRLLANGTEVSKVILNEDSGWSYTFKDLPKEADGKEITYTVKEDEQKGFHATITGDMDTGFVIENAAIKSPHTGDDSGIAVYGLTMILACAAVLITERKRRRI